ncbi:myomegalin-like [Pongo abelii]|uniref:myomegalin-like n=1 Tax=Pongo abelii TaxID=9601 RepID=UPI00300698B9
MIVKHSQPQVSQQKKFRHQVVVKTEDMKEGRGIYYLLTQHAKDTVKSFEDLLRSNDIDYYLGQSFREQHAQGSQLTETLTSKLSTKDHKSEKDQAGLEPLALRLSRELQEKEKVIEVLRAKLDAQSLTRSSSHALSDSHRSPSSTSFLSDELEACSDMDITNSIHHSSHSAVLFSKPSSTTASQGVKAESRSNPISLPTPQNPPKEANQAHSGMQQPMGQKLHLLFLCCLFDFSSRTEVWTVRGLNASKPRQNQETTLIHQLCLI